MLNKAEVLSEIVRSIQGLCESGNNVLTHTGADILRSIQNNQEEGLREGRCSAFAAEFGIGSLLFSECKMEFLIPDPSSVLFVHKDFLRSHRHLKDHLNVQDVKTVFERCRIVSFTDWGSFDGASDLWDRLRSDVIKPLARNNFEFIFYLGDTRNKLSYEVDEILDIMSDFSFHGKVTLVLKEKEASQVWRLLSGQEEKADAPLSFINDNGYKGGYIFNALDISRMLIYSTDHRITIFSSDGHEELAGQGLPSSKVQDTAREYFNSGYILGLVLQLSAIHCTALGLAVSRAYLNNEKIADLKVLAGFIKNWINEINPRLVGTPRI